MNGDFTALRSDNKVDYSNFQRLVINTDLGLALARMLLAKASVAEATEEERLATSALKSL